jgi:hypothetical protein
MIQDELELRYSYETLAKMVRLRDRCAAEKIGYPEARADVVAGIDNQIRKIEREIAAYLTQREEAEKVA